MEMYDGGEVGGMGVGCVGGGGTWRTEKGTNSGITVGRNELLADNFEKNSV